MRILDRYGNERDWAWLVANYGDLQIHGFTGPGWRIVELRENADIEMEGRKFIVGKPPWHGREEFYRGCFLEGGNVLAPSAIIAKFLDVNGNPVAEQRVCWYWPDAPLKTGCVPANGLEPGILPGRYDGPGMTNANGDIGFAMGSGAYYDPPGIGPHAIWPCCPELNGESCRGFGMLAGTNHFSVWPTFQWVEGESEECPWDEIFAKLAQMEKRLGNIQGDIADIRNLR